MDPSPTAAADATPLRCLGGGDGIPSPAAEAVDPWRRLRGRGGYRRPIARIGFNIFRSSSKYSLRTHMFKNCKRMVKLADQKASCPHVVASPPCASHNLQALPVRWQ
ncbi:hypothetical protein EJB05_37377, partial [Eragrostis curvula]